MSTIFKKELRYFFATPIAYIILGLYWLGLALFLWLIPGEWNIPQSGYAQLDGLFIISPWLFMLLCPAITMRLIAEERQRGTLQLLLIRPISPYRIIAQKYSASLTLCLIALLPCLLHYLFVYLLAQPIGNIDSAAFFGSLIGLFALIMVFLALGLFASSLTKSQIVSFIIGLLLCFFFFYGFDLLTLMLPNGRVVDVVCSFGMNAHYQSLARGLLDLRDITYFLSLTIIFTIITTLIINKKQ